MSKAIFAVFNSDWDGGFQRHDFKAYIFNTVLGYFFLGTNHYDSHTYFDFFYWEG